MLERNHINQISKNKQVRIISGKIGMKCGGALTESQTKMRNAKKQCTQCQRLGFVIISSLSLLQTICL